MRKKIGQFGDQLIVPGGPGGGRGGGGSGRVANTAQARENYLKGSVDQSVRDRGGYPTSKGSPKMTKAQERMETRKAAQGSPDYAKRQERKAKFGIKFLKGGLVPGK